MGRETRRVVERNGETRGDKQDGARKRGHRREEQGEAKKRGAGGPNRLYGCNVCGEGGEYETLTLDCPIFRRGSISLDAWEMKMHSPDSMAPVGVLHPLAFHVVPKSGPSAPAPPPSAFLSQRPDKPGSAPASPDPPGSTSLPTSPGVSSSKGEGGWAGSQDLGLSPDAERVPGDSGGVASLGSGWKGGESEGNVARWLESPVGVSGSGYRVSQASSLRELPLLAQAYSLPASLEAGAKPGTSEGVSLVFSGSSGTSFLTESTEDYARMADGLPGSWEEAGGRLHGLHTALESVAENGLPQDLTAWLVDVPDDFCGAASPGARSLGDPPEALQEGTVGEWGLRRSESGWQAWCSASGSGDSAGEQVASALRCALLCLASGTHACTARSVQLSRAVHTQMRGGEGVVEGSWSGTEPWCFWDGMCGRD